MAKPTIYRAALSPSDVVAGMNAALRNARRLADDAALLLAAGRWATAASLAILSMEEAGKVGVLRLLSIATDPLALKAGWKDYRSHQAKLKKPLGINPEGKSMADPAALAAAVQANANLVAALDLFKQGGFYTDCIPGDEGQPIWTEPVHHFTEERARVAVNCAIIVASKPDVPLRDVELWVEHLGLVYGTAGMIEGWRTFLAVMETEGLLHATSEEMEDRLFDTFFGKGWRGKPEHSNP